MARAKRFIARFLAWTFMCSGFGEAVLPHPGPRQGSECYPYLRRFKLISPGVGWAVVEQRAQTSSVDTDCRTPHLYWTDDNGQSWQEITPSPMPARNIGEIFFLDRKHGWILSTDALSEEENASFYLLSTEDGGKNWRTLVLQRPMFQLLDDYTFPSQLFFSDPRHGWMVWHWRMMNSAIDYLLATTDGGRTWKRLPDLPGPGPLQFTSAKDGWMIGGLDTFQGIPDSRNENLWRTHDGGAHWSVVHIAFPAEEEPGEKYFSSFRFKDAKNGVAVAESWVSTYVSRLFTCVTKDGGKSWSLSQFDAYHASPSFLGQQVVWSISDWPAMKVTLQTGGHSVSPVPPPGSAPGGRFGDFDFIDLTNAWTRYERDLLATSDGGKTLRDISPSVLREPPFPAPQLNAVNGILLRFPPTPLLPRGSRTPIRAPQGECHPQLGRAPAAGSPAQITGSGFLSDNTVWIGERSVPAKSTDGKNLRFIVPLDVVPGNYDVRVENKYGRTEAVQVPIRSAETLRISAIFNRDARYRDQSYRVESGMHRGQHLVLAGSGLLLENTLWFGITAVPTQLQVGGGSPMLNFEVPDSLAPGSYDLYVTNSNGKSNVLSVTIVE